MGVRDWFRRKTPTPSPPPSKVPPELTPKDTPAVEAIKDAIASNASSGGTSRGGGGGSSGGYGGGSSNLMTTRAGVTSVSTGQVVIPMKPIATQTGPTTQQLAFAQAQQRRDTQIIVSGSGGTKIGTSGYIGNAIVPGTGGLTANQYRRLLTDQAIKRGDITESQRGSVRFKGYVEPIIKDTITKTNGKKTGEYTSFTGADTAFLGTGINDLNNVISAGDFLGTGIRSTTGTNVKIPFWTRVKYAPQTGFNAFSSAIKEDTSPIPFLSSAFSGFGILDVGVGKTKGDTGLSQLPFETRGTENIYRVSPKNIKQIQTQNIISTGNLPPEVVLGKKAEFYAKDLQQQVNTGKLTVEEANILLGEKVKSYSTSTDFNAFLGAYGSKTAIGDVSQRTKLSDYTIPVGYVASSVIAPNVAGVVLGGDLIGKSTQSFGKGFLNKDLTTFQKVKEIGKGGVYAGLGLSSFGFVSQNLNLARNVDRQALRDIESASFKIDWKTSYRIKTKTGYTDYIKATKRSGTNKLDVELYSTSKIGGKSSRGTGAQTLRFDSFETGQRTFTTQGFNFKVNKPITIPKGDKDIFTYGVGTGKFSLTKQLSYKENPLKQIYGDRVGVLKTNLPKSYELPINFKQFDRNIQKFSYGGGVAEGKKAVIFSSGKPNIAVLSKNEIRSVVVTPKGTGFPTEFNVAEYGLKGFGYSKDIYGSLRIINLKTPTGTRIVSGGTKTIVGKGGSNLIQNLKLSSMVQSPTAISYPSLTKSVSSSLTKSVVKPTNILAGVIPASAYAGLGMYERTESIGMVMPRQSNVLETNYKFSERQPQIYSQGTSVLQQDKQKTKLILSSVVSQGSSTKTNQRNMIGQIQPQKTRTKQKTKQILKQVSINLPRMPRQPKPPRTPRIQKPPVGFAFKFPKYKMPKQSKGLYPVLGRRFGKFKVVGVGKSKQQALSLGKDWASRTLGATFTVKGAKQRKIKGFYSKEAKEGTLYVEKIGRRLKKRGTEVKEIQLYKKAKPKKKSKKRSKKK